MFDFVHEWKEVSKDEFFKAMGPQNVHPYPVGKFPYTSNYKTPSGTIVGKVVDYKNGGRLEHQYLLPR